MKATKHAEIRMSQRAISSTAIDFLYFYGEEEFQKGGTSKLFFTEKMRKKAIKDMKQLLQILTNNKSYYCVINNNTDEIITTGHSFQ